MKLIKKIFELGLSERGGSLGVTNSRKFYKNQNEKKKEDV
ncbi:unnamed protein product [Paramecium pentaurelia]|uniref:Uncharacterized protein n=1 Tax=Paramecium pentaurelia TaxID=43138 RepID=A0A8S1SS98_9CILI|nr:unnamed protein product [Paramecium pentaurelia]